METIQTLVKGLRQGHPLPQWTFRQLPGGSSNPLVKAGVLTPSSRSQKFVDCPDCDDCAFDEMPKWYSETDGPRSRQRLVFTCPRDMEVRDLPEDWIRIWDYDADRMADLISVAMGCEHHAPQHRDGYWRLGIAKDAIGKNKRELIVATHLDSLSDSVFGAIKNNGSILFVGHLGCDIPHCQVARRVFQFLDVLRFDAEGQLSILHDVISSRFGGDGSSKPHSKGPAEKRIEEALFDYAKTMLFAESALDCINHYYHKYYKEEPLLHMYSTEAPAEIQWYRDSVDVNFQTILSLRNEIAVAALALHDWDKYQYNNQVYTQLYKEIGIDNTLDKYVKNMQRSKINKNIAVILLILLLLALLVAYYMLYYRYQLYYRYYMDRVEEVNDTLLSDLPDEEKLMAVDKQLANVRNMPQDLLQILKQIRETLQLSIHANNVKQIEIELAEDECRQLKYEEGKLHISNNVLDNCLSTLKHETMYYPSRIHQLVNEATEKKSEENSKENHQEQESDILQSLDELVSYYKDLYSLLSAQAMRQVRSVKIPCKVFSLEDILPRHCELQGDQVLIQGDEVSMGYLLEIMQKQSGEPKLVIDVKEKDKRYVELQLMMNKVPYRDFFIPKVENIPFMICRQIVRENSESTNLRGCGIVAEAMDKGTMFRITIAKNSIYESI